jgi:hypothetical protein
VNRLAALQRVYFSAPVPRLSIIDWHVVAAVDTVAALEPASPADAQWLPERMPEVSMSFEHDGQAVSLLGELSLRSVAAGDWRFELTGDLEHRRTAPFRITLCAPIALVADGATLETKTLDLGVDGCRLEAAPSLAAGTPVQAALSLPGHDDPVAAMGIVGDQRDQVAFDADAGVRSRLAGFVIAWQRATWRQRQALARDAA